MAMCAVCRSEEAIYKVTGSVLGYRCARIARRKAADRGHEWRMTLLPRIRKQRALERKQKGRTKKAA